MDETEAGTTTRYYTHTDHLGSVTTVTDSDGTLVWDNEYLPFGEEHTPDESRFAMFTGKQKDPDTGLYYFNVRWYDASLGRFVTQDPIRDGVNWYAYCENNPLRFVDPTGLDPHQNGGQPHEQSDVKRSGDPDKDKDERDHDEDSNQKEPEQKEIEKKAEPPKEPVQDKPSTADIEPPKYDDLNNPPVTLGVGPEPQKNPIAEAATAVVNFFVGNFITAATKSNLTVDYTGKISLQPAFPGEIQDAKFGAFCDVAIVGAGIIELEAGKLL